MNGHSSGSVFRIVGVTLTLMLAACAPEDASVKAAMADQHQEEHASVEDAERAQTRIESAMAAKFGLESELAGPADINETVRLFGQVLADATRSVDVRARFPGLVRSVRVQVGDRIAAGAVLATVESDESLKSYPVLAPVAGVVVSRQANPGEQTGERTLFRIVDPSHVWVELRLFPGQRKQVSVGQPVRLSESSGEPLAEGDIDWIGIETRPDQSVTARVSLPNPEGRLIPGLHLSADVSVAMHRVPVAVQRAALQSLDDATVVFVQRGDIYAPRVIELGRQDAVRVEVLDGLEQGERYVVRNSYLIKADIEKDSAAHDH